MQSSNDAPSSRRCPDCGQAKSLEEFPRNRSMAFGRGVYCKPCHNARTRASVRRAGGARHYHLRRRYGVGASDVRLLIEKQGGLCALCETNPATQVDHDHKTGRVRGILCLHCNAGMGAFHDDPGIIERAIRYLEQHRGVTPT